MVAMKNSEQWRMRQAMQVVANYLPEEITEARAIWRLMDRYLCDLEKVKDQSDQADRAVVSFSSKSRAS